MATSKTRCAWPGDGSDDLMTAYHDTEWGTPLYDDSTLFEFLILEGVQAGLSWRTVLHKRENYRAAYDGFDPEKVARYTKRKNDALLKNPGIIRNKLKVAAAVTNAKAFLAVAEEFGSWAKYQWSWVPEGKPIQNAWKSMKQLPATSAESDAWAKDLKKRGFKFVGSTIIYAHMQATGMVNDHVAGCFRHAQCAKQGARKKRL